MIAYLHQADAFGAVESYLLSILAGLEEESVVIAPAAAALDPLGEAAQVRSYDPALTAPLLLAHLVRELRALRPRLVHVVDVWPLGFLATKLARVPRVVVTHHTPELPRQDNLLGKVLWQLGWLTRPEVIYTSEADRLSDGRRATVIPLGIDLARFAVPRAAPSGHVVGAVARLAPQKGLDTLVAAAPAVLARYPDARFVVVGDGESRADLERAAAGLPFEFTGMRDDVPALLSTFDVFACPSRFEGLCLAVIEAQAAGVPVVATPVGGLVETVVPHETGKVVPVDDPGALAAAINELFADPAAASTLVEVGRRRVFERFDVQQMVERTIALYG